MSMNPASASNSGLSAAASQYAYPSGSSFPLPFHLQNSDQQEQYPKPYLPPPPAAFPSPYPATTATGVYPLPQYQQAHQLFQRDAQTITPEALESVKAALASSEIEHKVETKRKQYLEKQLDKVGKIQHDFRLFCGDLGNEVNDDVLSKAFSRFPSFNMARVVRDKRTGKTKGYGFVSFATPLDLAAALKEMNGKYVGKRPIKLR